MAADGRSIKTEHEPNGSAVAITASAPKRRKPPTRSFSSWLFNNLARLSIWYALITVIFRCPSSPNELTVDHPRICKPYITARTHVQPYVQPYYDTYARSYVEAAKPYADQVNTRLVRPASVFAAKNYQKYAGPQIEKAKGHVYAQWDRTVLPQVHQAQKQAFDLYKANLAPHVEKASSIAGPYYESARDNALDVHQRHIIPAITYSKPHVESAFANAQRFVMETGLPYTQHAWSHLVIFVDGTLWPFFRAVYRDNVKPQLVMISERIAKYQESRRLQSVIDEIDISEEQASLRKESTSGTAATTETVIATDAATTSTISVASVDSSSSSSASPTPVVATDETVTEDLSKWQKKFGVAAEKGIEDLRERIEHIVSGFTKNGIAEGEGLANALEKTSEVELDGVKSKIKAVVRSLPEETTSSDLEAAEEEVVQAVRESGQKIKGRARSVREWADEFEKDLRGRTELAADSTLQVLDGIRDLGLQEIGMRWAWMEGITYRHWEKYHELKQTFEDWRTEVKAVAAKHSSVEEAHEAAQRVLEESMAVTENTAKELIRLKEVAKWKVRSHDDTDDFEARAMPAAAISAASSFAAEIQGTVSSLFADGQDTVDSFGSQASSSIVNAASSVSSYVAGSTGPVESVMSQASASVEDAMSHASSAVLGTSTGTVESLASEVSSSVSSVIYGTTGSVESLASEALSAASSVVYNAESSAESLASDVASSASSVIYGTSLDPVEAVSSVVLGTSTGSFESFSSSVASAASAATDAVSESLSSLVKSATLPPSEGVLSSGSSIVDQISSSASSIYSEVTNVL